MGRDPLLERWDEIDAVVSEALDLPESTREPFIARACDGDVDLMARVRTILSRVSEANDFLENRHRMDLLHATIGGGGEPRPADEDPSRAGERIGPWRLIRRIGRGGTGTVYLAERDDGAFSQRVALKVLRRGLDTEDVLARFRAERQILASLSHPHIARLLDGGATTDGRPYLVMELVEGETITEYADARRLSIDERLRLFVTVARAVQYAHRNLIVHRDLKPGNILVGTDGEVKLLDFGIAKLLDSSVLPQDTPHTRTGFRPMTPEYASPEQVAGEPVTTASDVYQLGILLYELLTGRRPYETEARSPAGLARAIERHDPIAPSAAVARAADGTDDRGLGVAALRRMDLRGLRSALRGDLDVLIRKALRHEPERRYASAAELADEIERHLDGRPLLARPDGWGYRAHRYARRHPGRIAAACLLFVAAVGYGVTLQAHSYRLEAERDHARSSAAAAELQAQRAERVTDFLAGLFAAADPNQTRGEQVTAMQLLEHGVAELEALSDQPRDQAELLEVIGGVYRSLGSYDEALRLSERALAIRRDLYGETHASVAQSLNDVATLLRRKGEAEDAERLHREALAIRRELFGEEHEDVAASLNNLALVLDSRGAIEEAERYYREALAINRRLLGDTHERIGGSLYNLGTLLERRGDLDGAETKTLEALAIWRQSLGEDAPNIAAALFNLGEVNRLRGDLGSAESFHRRAIEHWQRTIGPDHPHVGSGLNRLGLVLEASGDVEGAERALRDALELQSRVLGDSHPNTVDTRNHLARVSGTAGDRT